MFDYIGYLGLAAMCLILLAFSPLFTPSVFFLALEGLSHCYCWILLFLFVLEGCRSRSFKKVQCFQEVTPPRKFGRVGCIGLRYLQFNANVPGILEI